MSVTDRLPSHDEAAEGALLGLAMFSRPALLAVCSLPPDAWYLPRHRELADLLREMESAVGPVTPNTVAAEVHLRGKIKRLPLPWLFELFQSAHSPRGAVYLRDAIALHADIRALEAAAVFVLQAVAEPGAIADRSDLGAVAARVRDALDRIAPVLDWSQI